MPIYDSANTPPLLLEELRALWDYRGLIVQLVSRAVKTRYKRSVLGVAWTMLNPLLTMLVLTVVFSQVFRIQIENFPVYVLSGQLVWNFFASATSKAMGEMIWSGELLKRIYMPRSAFALAAVGTELVNWLLALIPLLAIALPLGVHPSLAWLSWPLAMILLSAFTLGLGLLLSTAAVYFGDMLPVYNVLLTIWLYATPVIYPLEIVPERWRVIFRFNPMVVYVELFRQPLLYGILPGREVWSAAVGFAFVALTLGALVFTWRADEYAYRL